MFRSLIAENTVELKSINKSVKKTASFQKGLDSTINKILGQKIGEVKNTLPTTRTKMDECMKKVGDADLCGIVMTKYSNFYNQICKATPAICDDQRVYPTMLDMNAMKKIPDRDRRI